MVAIDCVGGVPLGVLNWPMKSGDGRLDEGARSSCSTIRRQKRFEHCVTYRGGDAPGRLVFKGAVERAIGVNRMQGIKIPRERFILNPIILAPYEGNRGCLAAGEHFEQHSI